MDRPSPPWAAPRGLDALVARWTSDGATRRNLVLHEVIAGREAREAPIPDTLARPVADALRARGVRALYSHQAQAFELARAGVDIAVSTPTASGKSLCYNLPVLDRLAVEREARALYLFPTKALSRDQEDALRGLMADAGLSHGAITYDGDTPGDARRAARERSSILLSNPDMLHAGILPHHAAWARFFANLRYVVLDELHTYRGVFGSHLANVLRRLVRVARFHGSEPTFLFASATIGNPGEHASRIIGRPVQVIAESGAPTGQRHVMVYNPPVVNAELGIRASYLKTAVRLAGDLIQHEVPTIVFGQSRNGVETMLKYLRDRMRRSHTASGHIDEDAIVAYRGGYLADTRRRIEKGLRSGAIRCVVATNALELGIDIGSLDAVVCAGYPGSVAGLWQRFGRSGRRNGSSLSLLVTSSNPLDQYFANEPGLLVGAPIEHARIDPDNVEIFIQHLKCAAFELPFVEGEGFGDVPEEAVRDALGFLADHRVVHQAVNGEGKATWHWSTDAYPANHVSLRSVSWDNFVIIDVSVNVTLAEMDWRSAHTMLHEQAIYQHDGEQYQVERLDYENHKAYVRKVEPDYYTDAMTYTRVSVLREDDAAWLARGGAPFGCAVGHGDVSVIEKVVGYKKIKFHTHENVGYGDVRLPEMQMHTTSFWLTVPEDIVTALPFSRADALDALRGIGNAMHLTASVGLMCDPRDLGHTLGDRSDEDSPPTAGESAPGFDPTLFLYDHVPGGVGLSGRLFAERDAMLGRTRALIELCPCEVGCPSCIGPEAVGPLDLPLERAPGAQRDASRRDTRKARALVLLAALGAGPREVVRREAVSGEAVSPEAVSGEAVSPEAVSREAVPPEAVPQGGAARVVTVGTPGDTAP